MQLPNVLPSVLDAVTCRLLRRRYVLHVHGGLFAEFLGSLGGVRRWMVAAVLRGAARVVVLGDVWRTNLTRQVSGLELCVIPNAVEPVAEVRADQQRGGGVLFVGDLSEPKRPEDLLVAYAALPSPLRAQYPLTIVGGGEPHRQHWLEQLAERLGVAERVRFAGCQEYDTTQLLMGRADLLVLCSRAEGMPLVLLEAMKASLPAVATRVGAIPEMVSDGVEAALVPAGDTLALAKRMKNLLRAEGERCRMGRAARRRAEKQFAPTRFRSAIASLWEQAAPTTKKKSPAPLPKLASPTFRSLL